MPQSIVAWLSIGVVGHRALEATLSSLCPAATPNAKRVIPILVVA